MDELLTFLSATGAIAFCVAIVTGGYQWARWGWSGQAYLYRHRQQIDRAVERDLKDTVGLEDASTTEHIGA